MDSTIGGILLALIGFFLGFLTYRKHALFWNFTNTRLLRKYLGDTVTQTILYIVSIVLTVVGILLAVGVVC